MHVFGRVDEVASAQPCMCLKLQAWVVLALRAPGEHAQLAAQVGAARAVLHTSSYLGISRHTSVCNIVRGWFLQWIQPLCCTHPHMQPSQPQRAHTTTPGCELPHGAALREVFGSTAGVNAAQAGSGHATSS